MQTGQNLKFALSWRIKIGALFAIISHNVKANVDESNNPGLPI